MSHTNLLHYSFLGHLQEVHYAKNEIEQSQVELLMKGFRQLGAVQHALLPAFYVIDYAQRDYVLMSEAAQQVAGYHPEDFMDSGLDMLMDIYQKDDFRIYNEKVFTANKQFLQKVPQQEHGNYIFNYTFRIKSGDGSMAHILQRGTYITCPLTSQPLYSIGMVMNVTGMFDQRRIFHSIEKVGGNGALSARQVIQQNCFFPYEEDTLLSAREKDIAGHMASGLSIKQIADKLHLAENTVANHRKNMFRKTGAKNMAELIAFVVRHHIV